MAPRLRTKLYATSASPAWLEDARTKLQELADWQAEQEIPVTVQPDMFGVLEVNFTPAQLKALFRQKRGFYMSGTTKHITYSPKWTHRMDHTAYSAFPIVWHYERGTKRLAKLLGLPTPELQEFVRLAREWLALPKDLPTVSAWYETQLDRGQYSDLQYWLTTANEELGATRIEAWEAWWYWYLHKPQSPLRLSQGALRLVVGQAFLADYEALRQKPWPRQLRAALTPPTNRSVLNEWDALKEGPRRYRLSNTCDAHRYEKTTTPILRTAVKWAERELSSREGADEIQA
jgi:hypothetical protein